VIEHGSEFPIRSSELVPTNLLARLFRAGGYSNLENKRETPNFKSRRFLRGNIEL
jgi:hypothetical protein